MISEVVPRGKEFLFFALFSIIGVSTTRARSCMLPFDLGATRPPSLALPKATANGRKPQASLAPS